MTSPEVFLSYASEDKDSFVRDFAIKLRAKHGVDLWLDDWEIKLGDSLIDEIFEGGLKHADVVIIVLSKASVTKPWIREELNIAAYKRIKEEKKLRIIPVIIEDCEVPEVLKNTAWVKVENPENCDTEIQRILSAIFDISDKPALGTPPARFSASPPSISGLNKTDSLVLREIANLRLEKDRFIRLDMLCAQIEDIPREVLIDSLIILEEKNLLKLHCQSTTTERIPDLMQLTLYGFQKFMEGYCPDYESIFHHVAALIVNENIINSSRLASRVNRLPAFIYFLLQDMEQQGLIKVAPRANIDECLVLPNSISPALKRMLQQA